MSFDFIKNFNLNYKNKKEKINLVAVTKNRTIEEIKEAIFYGIKIISENKIQEAEKKYFELKDFFKDNNVEFHFIGHLQSNKAKKAVLMFDVIQSIDSYKIAYIVNKEAEKIKKIQEIFIQINIGEEKQKYGVKKENLFGLIDKIIEMKNLKLNGLMCIAPYFEDSEKTRPFFREMKLLFDNANKYLESKNIENMKFLSMGMTNDYEIAIEEGSNMIRIGRGIFGR